MIVRQEGYGLKVLCVLSASDKKDAARVCQQVWQRTDRESMSALFITDLFSHRASSAYRALAPHYPCAALITSLKVMRPSTPEPLISERFTPRSSAFCLAAFVASGSSWMATNSLAIRDLTLTLRYVTPC